MTDSPHLLTAAHIAEGDAKHVQHQFNANAIRQTRTLSAPTGLQRLGIHQVTLDPGRDSTTHHTHDADEEFLYILSGTGRARIGDDYFEVGPGDFMGFPAGSPAHSLTNTGDTPLTYLMGGERNAVDVVHYPDLNRVMMKRPDQNGETERLWADLPNVHLVEQRE